MFTYPLHKFTWIELNLSILNNITKEMPSIILIPLPTECKFYKNLSSKIYDKIELVHCSQMCILDLGKGDTVRDKKNSL